MTDKKIEVYERKTFYCSHCGQGKRVKILMGEISYCSLCGKKVYPADWKFVICFACGVKKKLVEEVKNDDTD